MASKRKRDTITDNSLLELFRKKTARSPAMEKESSSSSYSVEQSSDHVDQRSEIAVIQQTVNESLKKNKTLPPVQCLVPSIVTTLVPLALAVLEQHLQF